MDQDSSNPPMESVDETLADLGLWGGNDKTQISPIETPHVEHIHQEPEGRTSLNGGRGTNYSEESQLLVDIDRNEDIEGINNGTQTLGRETERLSFEDPRLFELGPDELSRPIVEKRPRRKLKSFKSQSSKESKEIKKDEEIPLKSIELIETRENDDNLRQDEEDEGIRDYSKETELLGEAEEDEVREKTSLDNFEELYMKLSNEKCAMDRLSKDALLIPSKYSTPSPPGTSRGVGPRINECPSIESFFKLAEKVTIHFLVLPGKKIYSKDIRLDRTILQIKQELEKIVRVPAQFLVLRRNKNLVMDYKTLKDCGGKPGKKVLRFTVEVNKRAVDEWKLDIPIENKIQHRPQTTTKLKIQKDKGWKTVNVSIEYPTERKLFIGGYRDKVTLKEYHHAHTQTPLVKKELKDSQKHKATQAFRETNNCMQTPQEVYTQVDRSDYYVTCQHQKLLMPRRYKSAAWWERHREKAAIIIQKYWRRWLAEREREERMTGLIKRVEWAEQIRKGRTEIRLAIKDDELYRQYNPTTLLDIELLYRAINLWRKQQIDYVTTNRWGAEKKAALAEIMEKEADLLLDLERAKSKILREKGSHLVENLYQKMGQPTRWLARTGKFVTMDTPQKAQARIFHQFYLDLAAPVTDYDDRVSLLGKVYELVKGHRSVTADYLVQLIGREITLMQRKARERLLVGLRRRILNGFFALCRDSTFNTEAGALQKVPFDIMKLRKDMKQCKGCRRMLYRDQFTITRGVTVTSRCLICMGLYRTCILRVDLNLYRRMLQELRLDEQEQGVESSVSYLIDAYDLQFLIEQIWHGQSALSGIDDRYLLRMCRWIKDKPWTPWNCVLLTEEEAVAHLHIDDMLSAYQQSFFDKVRLRHNAARNYFERTAKTSLKLDANLQIYCLNQGEGEKNNGESGKRKLFRHKKASIFGS